MDRPDLSNRQPLNVRCDSCGHVWVALYLPMPLSAASQVLGGARCPACASKSDQHFATEEKP